MVVHGQEVTRMKGLHFSSTSANGRTVRLFLRPEAEQVILGPGVLGGMKMAVMSYDQGLSSFRSPCSQGDY